MVIFNMPGLFFDSGTCSAYPAGDHYCHQPPRALRQTMVFVQVHVPFLVPTGSNCVPVPAADVYISMEHSL